MFIGIDYYGEIDVFDFVNDDVDEEVFFGYCIGLVVIIL